MRVSGAFVTAERSTQTLVFTGNHMDRVSKIIFLVSSPFNRRDNDRFGVELLRENGFAVEIWDLTPIVNPARWKAAAAPEGGQFKNYAVFTRKRDAADALLRLAGECWVVSMVNYSFENLWLFRVLSRCGLPYSFVIYNVPCFDCHPQMGKIQWLSRIFSRELLSYLFWKVPYRVFGVKPASAILMLGGKVDLSIYPVDATTDIVKSHYFDYDAYLHEIRNPVQADPALGVFLDNYLPFHPDWGAASPLDPAEYYPLLRKFFDLLEEKHGMRIVVAAHPRSLYEKLPDYFGGRPVIMGDTVNLVRRSRFVIAHQSASTSYAILFNKPLVFVTTDSLQRTDLGPLTEFIAAALKKTVINLSGEYEFRPEREFTVDGPGYQSYQRTYIKEEGREDLPIWQTFANYIKNACR